MKNTCDCKKLTCKHTCKKKHTHKSFFCEKCNPPMDSVDWHAYLANQLKDPEIKKEYDNTQLFSTELEIYKICMGKDSVPFPILKKIRAVLEKKENEIRHDYEILVNTMLDYADSLKRIVKKHKGTKAELEKKLKIK